MIDYIVGTLAELAPTCAVVEAHGVGYAMNISLTTYSALEGHCDAKLFVYENIREDAWVLFGFATKAERELFIHLISVNGVGGNTARTILSSYSVSELCRIIVDKQEGLLKGVKGIGPKTAQRIIVELGDKLRNSKLLSDDGCSSAVVLDDKSGKISEEGEEAIAALTMLGFSPAPTKKAVRQILEEDMTLKVEAIIKKALKMM